MLGFEQHGSVLAEEAVHFSVESRVLRELGERLVKQPEVALIELVKNSYDADSTTCSIRHVPSKSITIEDDGHGMTLNAFLNSWMRIGASTKTATPTTNGFGRAITGEKGIGRFAVRFLGRHLTLETVAFDQLRGFNTVLYATFDWTTFDQNQDLGLLNVPYILARASEADSQGTRLTISQLRPAARTIDLRAVRSFALDVASPYGALLSDLPPTTGHTVTSHSPDSLVATQPDPGFAVLLPDEVEDSGNSQGSDVSNALLRNYVLRATVTLEGDALNIKLFRRGQSKPSVEIVDTYPNSAAPLAADIRFFPNRRGTFTAMGVDGRAAKRWVSRHGGIAVFDRGFRVHPYGTSGDDWLRLAADVSKRAREPRSTIAAKHFAMTDDVRNSTQLNYMLRLPYPGQLVGVVRVAGTRSTNDTSGAEGLIPATDREGFTHNEAFLQLFDVLRGAVEGLAYEDRTLQQEQERLEQEQLVSTLRKETRDAIKEVQSNPNIAQAEKLKIVRHLSNTQDLAERHEQASRERETALETMSLLGVVSGFMSHEFGTALAALQEAERIVRRVSKRDSGLRQSADALAESVGILREFVTYSQGYVQGAGTVPTRPYLARPRLQQVVRVFGKYASDRDIAVSIDTTAELTAPLVPVSLYNGVALNLFTNALKAVTAKATSDKRIAFVAREVDGQHTLDVADTGIGIPESLQKRVFDPLFTTTATNRDPLGSGMGLGLALVRRGVEAFGGKVLLVKAPDGFTTCFRVRFPVLG